MRSFYHFCSRICPSRKCQRMYERLVVTYASAIIVDSEPRKEWCESCYGRRVRDIMVKWEGGLGIMLLIDT